ncbi:YTH domain-containing family protein 3-like isoform X1 [Cucumis melo var. makuwa]|uniref:YTH domain-containing family protein n=2 Tax=Cucumis melo TaxID=3656 RepID=A0A5D3BV36_CUCMM|nr:YTH domain-containing family protein 3-like isoform X1 [Cucumis melo var. makuwa]
MYNEGANPEFIFDQGVYYPTAANYGYYCTGFESPGEWEDHSRIFGLDGPDVQYAGAQNENSSYVYYTPSYGYAQSQYNPYNPYIHGAMIGPDGPYLGAQQFYTIPSYDSSVTSPAYVPVIVQPDIVPNSSIDLIDPSINRSNGNGRMQKNESSGSFSRNHSKPALDQRNSLARLSEVPRANVGPSKQSGTLGSISAGGHAGSVSSRVFQGRGAYGSIQPVDDISNGKVVSQHSQLRGPHPINNAFSDFRPSAHGQAAIAKFQPKVQVGRVLDSANASSDALSEQNRGPRISRSKAQLALKAYTTKAGDGNADGNIIIYTDQYNKDDFPIEYTDAKFFVIKSYSEDDVHKSIKYNVWSSTPNGNKKLNIAYEDARRIVSAKSRSCPVFLFFSVNASGQFCGVAEMVGPVDFNRDMDFWQQDKWNGSFPVKWHIIKDVPNNNFRHVILENNENKPVTNSRDTQEIPLKKGLEMLKLFKSHTLKTSLLDDFIYYENRQKIMQEEKARLVIRRLERPYFVPALDHTRQLNCVVELPLREDKNLNKANDGPRVLERNAASRAEQQVYSNPGNAGAVVVKESPKPNAEEKVDVTSTLKMESLEISPKVVENPLGGATPAAASDTNSKNHTEVVTVGSMPIKVNGYNTETSGVLTVGTIPLDPKALQLDKEDAFPNNGSQHK